MAPRPGTATTGAARCWLMAAGLAVAGVAGGLAPLSAQPVPGNAPPGIGAEAVPRMAPSIAPDMGADMAPDMAPAPLILAPEDAGRQVPSVSMLPEGGGINGFATVEPAPPPAAELAVANMPVVVEMFTAQGCSSCPPADTMLGMLAGQPDVLALSYHVDYWDYLGWPDSFARPEFTERQTAYANAAGERSVYTPQMIIEGQDTSVAPGPAQLMGLIDAHRYAPALVSVQRDPTPEGERIEVSPLSELGPSVEVMLVRYAPERRVDVTAGENRGRAVIYSNVVLGLQHLSWWDGLQPLRLTVRADLVSDGAYPDDTRHAVLIQQMRGPRTLPGPILAAIRLD